MQEPLSHTEVFTHRAASNGQSNANWTDRLWVLIARESQLSVTCDNPPTQIVPICDENASLFQAKMAPCDKLEKSTNELLLVHDSGDGEMDALGVLCIRITAALERARRAALAMRKLHLVIERSAIGLEDAGKLNKLNYSDTSL